MEIFDKILKSLQEEVYKVIDGECDNKLKVGIGIGLERAKAVVEKHLNEPKTKKPTTSPLNKEVDKTLYSERAGFNPPDSFIQVLHSKGFKRIPDGRYELKKGDCKISVNFDFKTYSVVAVIRHDGEKFYTYTGTFKDTDLEGFIKTLEAVESSILKN